MWENLAIVAVLGTIGHNFMPRKSISEPVFIKSRRRWKADIPASISDTGRRIRAYFKTRELAREYIAKLAPEDDDEQIATIPPALAMEADKARKILEPWNLDLVQAARIISVSLGGLQGTAAGIEKACKFYADNHAKKTASKPFGEAVAEYLDSRSDLRNSTLGSYRYTLERNLAALNPMILATITDADIESILKGKGATSKDIHLRNFRAFWRWACKAPRRWADPEVIEGLEPARISKDSDITILNHEEAKSLLRAAEKECASAAAAFAIALFAGVRMAELARLTWGDVKDDYIEIGKSISKKSARRFIPYAEPLKSWLTSYSGDSSPDSLIVPANWREVSKNVRRRAGWKVVTRYLKNPPKPTRGIWPSNALRHTCASIHVAIGTQLETLIFQFGHTGTQETLKRHYARRMTREDAEKILSIL